MLISDEATSLSDGTAEAASGLLLDPAQPMVPSVAENPANLAASAAEGGWGAASGPINAANDETKAAIERAYGAPFAVLDGVGGEVLMPAPGQPSRDWEACAELCREVSRRGRPEFIEEEGPFLTLALPWTDAQGGEFVAVATFLTREIEAGENLAGSARLLGIDPGEASEWARRQTPWNADSLRRTADLVLENIRAGRRIQALQEEAGSLSVNLATTYEEISLLYRLTQNLKISRSDEDLGRVALEWMQEVVPAAGLAIQFSPPGDTRNAAPRADDGWPPLLSYGECPIDAKDFDRLMKYLNVGSLHRPIVANRSVTERPDWPCPQIRQVIAVVLAEGDNTFGCLAALNHNEDAEFGTVEASLLNSVAAILGIHRGNIELYRQQSDLLAGIVRALSSAIDAKDPYTCGHSDRVARVAVRLAEELGCDAKMLNTLYLAGLLHDIGKIGIDDGVLRKASHLSDTEYLHIKQHALIGYRILQDLTKLEDVLPVVLHHHESWNGNGYPYQLDAERIPLAARVVAVADAFDAMSSDRPYRKGLPNEKVEDTLRQGAGRQWDPEVIDAFFRCREDIWRICRERSSNAEREIYRKLR